MQVDEVARNVHRDELPVAVEPVHIAADKTVDEQHGAVHARLARDEYFARPDCDRAVDRCLERL